MANAKRVVFSFDERSLESLENLKEQGRFSSMGEAVRESLQINRALRSQAEQGFTEVIVRNPATKEERWIVIS
jgi:Arc/MetJ-type ribon-helix-helix transcriptional regulator